MLEKLSKLPWVQRMTFSARNLENSFAQSTSHQVQALQDQMNTSFKAVAEILKQNLSEKALEARIGEEYARIFFAAGEQAHKFLFKSQWGHGSPEWFDHRHALFAPDKFVGDYEAVSIAQVIAALPYGGTLLDLCSGDGFFDYYYYSKRAKHIVAVDFDPTAIEHAKLHSKRENIEYRQASVFDLSFPAATFDVVCMRSAIEHFNQNDQQKLMAQIKTFLKPGGYFVGDTPANVQKDSKSLEHHEFEWENEAQMRTELGRSFSNFETSTLESLEPSGAIRKTLFWKCRV